ncbi:autoinducer binding domain-containing protein [Bradyrhizobium sp. LM2.3]
MDLFCLIECAKQSRSPELLFDLLVSCSSEQGFSQVAYGALTDAEPTRRPEYLPAAVTVNVPSAWCERYAERRYNAIDPVIRRTTMQSAPFLMGSTRSQISIATRRNACVERGQRGRSEARRNRTTAWTICRILCIQVRRCRP